MSTENQLLRDVNNANSKFETWATTTNQGYNLTREDGAHMATYKNSNTEHAWRGYCHATLAQIAQEREESPGDVDKYSYFRDCLGDSYTPIVFGRHEGLHPQRVREAMVALKNQPWADVIAALVFDIELRRQREVRWASQIQEMHLTTVAPARQNNQEQATRVAHHLAQNALSTLADYVERSTHWREGGATRHDALLAIKDLSTAQVASPLNRSTAPEPTLIDVWRAMARWRKADTEQNSIAVSEAVRAFATDWAAFVDPGCGRQACAAATESASKLQKAS